MIFNITLRSSFVLLFVVVISYAKGQAILPPVNEWKGKSELLISKSGSAWETPAEKSGFRTTPRYNETMQWLKKLDAASPLISMVSIGKSVEGRDIYMVIASQAKVVTPQALKKSGKPLLLVQAGIHAGEIDGKDAGLMLLRDIALGNQQHLLNGANFIFIPILNVDGHERTSPYNRPNQRGPDNMGWRTNAQNLNLNRDYTKLDTKEIRSVVKVINEYDPLLYMDLHVTDGADYQYDITFGGIGQQGYSYAINDWLSKTYKPMADKHLTASGHIPGPLLFAVNDYDFTQGNAVTRAEPRFSDSYGDLRHLATILVENHSLKPYKQRVLGTYVLLESTLKILATESGSLKQSTLADKAKRETKIPVDWKIPQMENGVTIVLGDNNKHSEKNIPLPDSLVLLGIESKMVKSEITNQDYVEWTGKKVMTTIPDYKGTEPTKWIAKPKGYWVPAANNEVIERLKMHGIKMEITKEQKEATVEMYRIREAQFLNGKGSLQPFEGHVQIKGKPVAEIRKQLFPAGSAYIDVDQPLGDLAAILLEPNAPDSYFSWGFFMTIFQRTEYIEAYVMEPLIKQMLAQSPSLKKEFEEKKAQDHNFANNSNAIFSWFYSKSKYYDDHYLLYPIGRSL